jgi:hypothetical protein
MAHGPYDPATQFLLDTMHDPSVSIRHRIECAALLLKLNPEEFLVRTVRDPDAPTIKIIIEGLGAGTVLTNTPTHQRTDSGEDDPGPARLN